MRDCIYRDAAIEAFDDPRVEYNYGDVSPESVIRVIESIPAADVAPVVRGKWIAEQFVDDGGLLHEILSEHDTLVCSSCGFRYLDLFDRPRYYYCPNCGALMEGNDGLYRES